MSWQGLRADSIGLLVFELSERRYALPVAAVDRIARVVDVTPLPKAPDIVLGVVNAQGRIVPVVNVRRRFGLPEREIVLTDRLIFAHTARRLVALLADAVAGVFEPPERETVAAQEVLTGLDHIEGVVKLDGGLILIHDLDRFLSLDEEAALDRALEDG